ncbi:hypothetical protein ACFRCG_17365 [Embleya sp. NPDC056575]|uniref:hypothetical protein n=1 Tax=unclassified Embleya TaxID=2699296 RepID=UPI003688C14E
MTSTVALRPGEQVGIDTARLDVPALFEDGTWWIPRRLERCYADLTDPALRHRTIGEIAARWGMRPGDVGRVFRNAYGAAPHEIRARARDADGPRAAG